jgi:hypothetical protein
MLSREGFQREKPSFDKHHGSLLQLVPFQALSTGILWALTDRISDWAGETEDVGAEHAETEQAETTQIDNEADSETQNVYRPVLEARHEKVGNTLVRDDYDRTEEDAEDLIQKRDQRPPKSGAVEAMGAPPEEDSLSYEKELMDLKVVESCELCRRIRDSCKAHDKPSVERREDGTLILKDYNVVLSSNGDAFGSYHGLQRWIKDRGMAGSRKDGSVLVQRELELAGADLTNKVSS